MVGKGSAEQKEELIALVNKIKSVPCADCTNTFPVCAMDLDHLPGMGKSFTISTFLRNEGSKPGARLLLERELARIEVVCSNCHRVRTRDRARQAGKARF